MDIECVTVTADGYWMSYCYFRWIYWMSYFRWILNVLLLL